MQDLSIRISTRAADGAVQTIDIGRPLSAPIVELGSPIDVQAPAPDGNRFIRVNADGERMADDATGDHVAVIDTTTGLMWSVESLGDPADEDDGITQEHCIERCKRLRLLGFDDWRLPTRTELAGLVDDTRHDPAIDTRFFPRVKPRWHWTSTAAAWSSAGAWVVLFGYGHVYNLHRSHDGFALAVRRSGQSSVSLT